ncbi:hypothetical protein [Paracidovorax konjaci]|nr:hypothetical protein [Paracidovorax konjaci]
MRIKRMHGHLPRGENIILSALVCTSYMVTEAGATLYAARSIWKAKINTPLKNVMPTKSPMTTKIIFFIAIWMCTFAAHRG